jgi:alpha-ketoglutarate-dependent taurine dioxygenase
MSETKRSSFLSKFPGPDSETSGIPPGNEVTAERLLSEKLSPLIIRPAMDGISLIDWARANRSLIETELLQHGAILFRGFRGLRVQAFQTFAEATSSNGLIDYKFRSTPRKEVSGKIYTSTEYPASQSIPLHNEMSYARNWPMKIWFHCVKPAMQGGATPIASSARVFQRIAEAVRAKFIRHGIMYVRNYHEGIDLSYKEVFGTANRAEIEGFCREAGIECEFGGGVQLRTRQRCQAVSVHPTTGDTVWFNQAHLFHTSSLDPAYSGPLLALYGKDRIPRNCYYGDGSEIGEADLGEVREAYRQEMVSFPWHTGDVLMLDNMLVAHGRESFAGERQVVVAMAEETSLSERAR